MLREKAIEYIKGLNERERGKLKTMLENGITCCVGYAKDLNLDVNEFNAELRRIFK